MTRPFDELLKHTNVGDLLPQAPPAEDLTQPMPQAPDANVVVKPNTNDPLESNFGSVHIAEGLGKDTIKPGVRRFAWIFLAGPMIVSWFGFAWMALENLATQPQTFKSVAGLVAGMAMATVFCGFWPYVLLKRK
jgi:hypothetical protein